MHKELFSFAAQWLRVAVMTLVPVVLTAFLTIPWNLGGYPGQGSISIAAGERHMT